MLCDNKYINYQDLILIKMMNLTYKFYNGMNLEKEIMRDNMRQRR